MARRDPKTAPRQRLATSLTHNCHTALQNCNNIAVYVPVFQFSAAMRLTLPRKQDYFPLPDQKIN